MLIARVEVACTTPAVAKSVPLKAPIAKVVVVALVAVKLVVEKRPVVVAFVPVALTKTRFVMVEEALLTSIGTEVVGESMPPKSSHDCPALLLRHVPAIAQHPLVRLTPLAKDEVAAEEEKRAFAMVVEAWVMEKRVEVA